MNERHVKKVCDSATVYFLCSCPVGGAEALSGNYPLFPEALSGDRRLSSVCLSDVAYDIKYDMIFLYFCLLMFDNFVCDSATVYFFNMSFIHMIFLYLCLLMFDF